MGCARPGLTMPIAFRDPNRTIREVALPKSCISLVQLKSNTDNGDKKISDFLPKARADLEARKPCVIIFDLRPDGGGDYTDTGPFGAGLPGIVGPRGHIHVLTDTDTFSAGITTVVFTKQAVIL